MSVCERSVAALKIGGGWGGGESMMLEGASAGASDNKAMEKQTDETKYQNLL